MESGGGGSGGSGGSYEGEVGQPSFFLKSLNLAQTVAAVQTFLILLPLAEDFKPL